MKKKWAGIMSALTGVFLAGTAQAVIIETNLNLEAATYPGADVIMTRLQYGSATFDIVYTLDSLANGSNSFVQANGTLAGVGSDTDIANHYTTLEGDDGEGMSFTGLVLTNFVAGNSGLVREDISDVKFVGLSVASANNNQDGVAISFIGHGLTNVNVNLNTGGASQTVDLTALTNYPASATDLYIKCDNGNKANRWNFAGVGVSYDVNLGVNELPVADPQSFTMFPGTTISNITLTGSDYEESPLTYTVDDSLLIGTLTGATNVWTYTPPVDYRGLDNFTFTVNDGVSDSAPATVSFNVTNDVPSAAEQSVDVYTYGSVDFSLAATDTDSGPGNLTYTVLSQPSEGTLVTNGVLPNLTYSPTGTYTGEDTFTFSVFDGMDESETATVTLHVLNNPPVADSKIVSTQPDIPVAVTLTGSDLEGSTVTLGVETYPANGALTGIAPNMLYTPAPGFSGVDTFTYSASDGMTTGSVATVSISVSADGFIVPFVNLNAALSGNTLNVGGIPADVTGTTNGLDYVYSVSFTGADVDGDDVNDELTFDVRVKAWTNGVTDLGFDSSIGNVSSNIATATIGTSNVAVSVTSFDSFAVVGNTIPDGASLEFNIENLAVSLTDGNQAGSATSQGFNAVLLAEINKGNSHHTIFGEGSELLGWMWSLNTQEVTDLDYGSEQFYVSSSATTNTAATRPFNWAVDALDFGISVTLDSADIPPVTMGISDSGLVFSWEGGGTYDVLSSESLAHADWGVAIENANSPVSAPIGTEPVLFFKLSE